MMSRHRHRVGIDVGGTFTDLALLSDDGQLHIFKVPSRPSDIAAGCLEGLRELLTEVEVPPSEVDYWSHGSTVATNAVVERKGAKMALLATKGFRDILEIRRQVKPDRYNLHRLKPSPLVPRDRRFDVDERILWDGSVHVPLDEHQLNVLLDSMDELELEAVAICFLHSYVNPVHEQLVLERIRQRLPRVYVAASHEVLPEFREYPRTSTTVINAYVGPVMERYLTRFNEGGRAMGIKPPLTVFQSNGGITSASTASRLPVKVLHSGPAAGVHGAVQVAREAGYPHVITFDMGGTSCDVCLIRDGTPLLAGEKEMAGFPVRSPMIDVHSIGAGGGSIAWVDKGGLLQVGPQSAGADPGPACYGRGGTAATVTDANVVLGRLNPDFLLGGRLKVYRERARDAVSALAERLDLSLEEAALGILDVVNSNMMGAIRVVSVERGYDYRDCVLMGFGGAGPLHVADVAGDMGIRTVLIPRVPGILCAMGLLLADYRSDFTRTHIMPVTSECWQEMERVFAGLEELARLWAAENGLPDVKAEWRRFVAMRYAGQSYQLSVQASGMTNSADVDALLEVFYSAHALAYGYAQRDAPVEIVDFHLSHVIPIPRPKLAPVWQNQRADCVAKAQVAERRVCFKAGSVASPVYRRELLPSECSLRGPAILEQLDSTTVVPPQAKAVVDKDDNIRILLAEA